MKKINLIFCLFVALPLFGQHDAWLEEILLHRRTTYFEKNISNPRAPYTLDDTLYLNFFEVDPDYLVQAIFKRAAEEHIFDMALFNGDTRKYRTFGTIEFSLGNEHLKLEVYQDISHANNPLYRNYLFLPFKDLTNGNETYGGGRYMNLLLSDIDEEGHIIVDFNRAYNPWCVYSDGYRCPVPPLANHLQVPVYAGEKNYLKEN